MKTNKHIETIRVSDQFIDSYIKESSPLEISQIVSELPEKAKAFSIFLGNTSVDALHLTLLAEVLHRKRKEDLALLKHSKNEKKGYQGSKELLQLLNEYTDGKIGISNVRFDFKKLYDKDEKRKSNADIKKESARSISIKGNKVINRMIFTLVEGQMKESLAAFSSYENLPVFKPDEYPDRKVVFVRKHNRIATNELIRFFNTYKDIPIKERKILSMKALVFMKFLDSHEQYKKQLEAKKTKKVLVENEYYLQRYSEFTRTQ